MEIDQVPLAPVPLFSGFESFRDLKFPSIWAAESPPGKVSFAVGTEGDAVLNLRKAI